MKKVLKSQIIDTDTGEVLYNKTEDLFYNSAAQVRKRFELVKGSFFRGLSINRNLSFRFEVLKDEFIEPDMFDNPLSHPASFDCPCVY